MLLIILYHYLEVNAEKEAVEVTLKEKKSLGTANSAKAIPRSD